MLRGHGRATPSGGYTLLEALVVVALAGVLAAIAWPSVEQHVRKARRADAILATLQVRLAQERFRSQAPAYGALEEIGVPAVTPGGHYGLEIAAHDATGFELLAQATGAQSRDADCRFMGLRSRELTPNYASGPDRRLANDPALNRRCWNQ
ncbi:MAG: prepilin-type N-terminal cleavage/methylation domain-containing protein [Pseudomonadota bacterium]|nr:prepilin-type N-terminal cleavage/methylation domain-containing protein [Pseudomonadota bacterium]